MADKPQKWSAQYRLRPANWGISTRSAIVCAFVVLAAGLVTSAGLLFILNRLLLSSVDDAAGRRVRDIVAALDFDTAADLDNSMLAVDQRIRAVQVIGADGKVIRRSASAPDTSLLPVNWFGTSLRTGIPDELSPQDDMRLSGQTARTATGTYTVIVGAGSESAEHIVASIALLLAIAVVIITGVAAAATFRLVKRSLRSVETIRSRVAEISASDLSQRVPVPAPNDEISALATTMNEMLARVESGHDAQRRFVGDASHELRSPLASILSALEVAHESPEALDDELTSGTLIPEAHRMQALVEDLLLLARADERGLPLRDNDIDLDVLAEAEADRLRRETDLDIRLHSEAATVTGDLGGIARVLRNLLDNAVLHATSTVEITVKRHKTFATISVADDGPGIPAQDRTRVFDRFVRLDPDRSRDGGGSGLGLAIVAEVVASHNGAVSIDDRPGGGAIVTVTLPSVT
ncbi:ATP-binding protein [Mycobacterium seoulense]|uniref:sensor histidine kinase n=1 Tax=Mycobacterium seoulense TaxID=386911 RepID=UPI003CF0A583